MRRTLVAAMVAVVAVVLFAHDVPLARHLRQVERDRLVTSLERDAFVIAGMAEGDVHEPDEQTENATQRLFETIQRYEAIEHVRVVIVDAKGVAVMTSDGTDIGDVFLNRPEIVEALSGQPAVGPRYSGTLKTNLFYVAVPIFSPDGPVGAVRLTAPDDAVTERVNSRVRGMFVVAMLSLLIALAVAWVVAGRLTKPIETLRRTTQRVAEGDLTARADDTEGPPEVRALADSLNTMTARLSSSIERQKAFAGTASHQLRTPLTALRLRLEALGAGLENGGAATDNADAVGAVDAALAETDRLHRMIEGLLALARAEGTSTTESVDVAAVAAERVAYWSPLADEQEVAIVSASESSASADVIAEAVPGALEQILDNLIDNALGVAPPGSSILVRATPVPGSNSDWVAVHVLDEGPGLDDDQRAQAFERFWRGSASGPGGTGLGLAIVRQLAEASGGTAELRSAPSGGIDATVTLRRSSRSTT